MFLICDAGFFNNYEGNNLDLGLGLGLGVGIPVLLALYFILFAKGGLPCKKKGAMNNEINKLSEIVPYRAPTLLPLIQKLTEASYRDLCFDNLSDTLKTELMILRLKEGRDLTEILTVAKDKKSTEVVAWLEAMNPCDFPASIREAAYGKPMEV